MKIAYISHHTRPCYEFNFFSQLDFEKIKFIDTNFDSYPEKKDIKLEYCKVDFKENKILNRFFHSTATFVKYKNFEKYLEDVDLVIVLEVFSSLSKQFIKYCKKHNKKVISFVYELVPNHLIYKIPPYIFNKMYCIKNSDFFITVSNMAKKHLIQLGAKNDKIQTIYPGINPTNFFYDKNIIKNYKRIIYIGRLDKHKGIDIAINICNKLLLKQEHFEMWFIGDGQYKTEIEKLCNNNKNIKYFGQIANSELQKYLSQSAIYLLPCRDTYKFGFKIGSEQFGFSFAEAMMCGLSIISTNCGAIPEIITNNNIISKQNDENFILESIVKLLHNEKLIKDTGNKNIFIANEKYDIKKQSIKLTNEIKYIIKK